MKSRAFFATVAVLISLCADAKLTVTRLICNYQGCPVTAAGGGCISQTAITEGDITLGWQMTAETNGEKQSAYEITISENVTDRQVYKTGKVKSDQSQLIKLPALKPNRHGYYWQVRVWNDKGEKSNLSRKQKIRVVPAKIDA